MALIVGIPADLRSNSIELIRSMISSLEEEAIHLILIHGIFTPNSLPDLLYMDKKELALEIASPEFTNHLCELLKNNSQVIVDVQLEFFIGNSQRAFNDLIQTLGIELLVLPSNDCFDWSHKKSMDILPFMKKSPLNNRIVHLN